MGEVGPLMEWGSLGEVEESLTVEGIGTGSYYDLTLESEAKASISCASLRNVSSFLRMSRRGMKDGYLHLHPHQSNCS